jgi:hypothetical protein
MYHGMVKYFEEEMTNPSSTRKTPITPCIYPAMHKIPLDGPTVVFGLEAWDLNEAKVEEITRPYAILWSV